MKKKKCKLTIQLENEIKEYRIGDELRGMVEVSVDSECHCNELVIERFWQMSGQGKITNGCPEKMVLYRGTWQPGVYQYEFEFLLFDEPVSYQGKNMNIKWCLKARANTPRGKDPIVNQDFLLLTNPQTSPANRVEFKDKSADQLFVVGLCLFLSPFALHSAWQEDDYYYLLIGVGLLIPVFVAFWKLLKPMIAQKQVGKVDYQLNKTVFKPKESIEVNIKFKPPETVTINSIKATLLMVESVEDRFGDDIRILNHTVRQAKTELADPFEISADASFCETISVQVPESAMHSFQIKRNSLEWSLCLEIDIQDWPDWSVTVPIQVTA